MSSRFTRRVEPRVHRPAWQSHLAAIGKLPLPGDPADRREHWSTGFGGPGPAQYVVSFNDIETLHQAAAQGPGIALARRMLAQPLIDGGRLVVLTKKRLEPGFATACVSVALPGRPGFLGHARVAAGASRTGALILWSGLGAPAGAIAGASRSGRALTSAAI